MSLPTSNWLVGFLVKHWGPFISTEIRFSDTFKVLAQVTYRLSLVPWHQMNCLEDSFLLGNKAGLSLSVGPIVQLCAIPLFATMMQG